MTTKILHQTDGTSRAPLGTSQDADLARRAADVLSLVGIDLDDVAVTVDAGRVALSGAVAWNDQRIAATRAVAMIPGVKGVFSRIALEPAKPALPAA
jgi:osmotically-inducible protein OsmY